MKILTSRYAHIGLALFVAVLLIAAFGGSASAAGPVYHTVQHGQTLYSIANHYHTSVWAIACANGIYNPNYIYAGQVLLISYDKGHGCKPAHKPYDKDYGKGDHGRPDYGKDYGKPDYGKDYGRPDMVKYPQKPDHKFGCFYTVRWGDHLYRIGLKYGVSWVVLAHANGLHNSNYIYAGQVLRVPCAVY
jgi:LysM repeat protein